MPGVKRFAALYAVLVGVPVLALFGILRLGAGIEPPLSVGGTWRVAAVDGGALPEILGGAGVATFAIAQSGGRLDVTLGSGTQPASGRIDGRRLWAEHRRDGAVRWRLDANLTGADTLTGEWKAASEAGIRFEARRESTGAVRPRGH